MLIKKNAGFGKLGLMVIIIMILFGVSGCSRNTMDDVAKNTSENNQKSNEYNTQDYEEKAEEKTEEKAEEKTEEKAEEKAEEWADEKATEKAEEIMELCVDFFRKATEENRSLDLEETKKIVSRLGENGYSAVDSDNQVDMTQTEPVLAFCENVDTKKEAEITMVEVNYMDGIIIYDLHTEDGKVDVVRDYYRYENGGMQKNASESY